MRDLRVYSQPLGGEIRQYLDNKGLEVDAIFQSGDAWAATMIPCDRTVAQLVDLRRPV